MALCFPQYLASQRDMPMTPLNSDFLPPTTFCKPDASTCTFKICRKSQKTYLSIACSSVKLVRDPSLDKHVVNQNKIRLVEKLRTLILSNPKKYLPLTVLSKCHSYLSLSKPCSVLSVIHRFPTIFELFTMPTPSAPLNAAKPHSHICVRLAPAASALANQESKLKSAMSIILVNKLQKLLMLSSHQRLLLSKLVHLSPDLGLPPNFLSRLPNDHPDKFRNVDTSYGRALELISWESQLANPLPSREAKPIGLIVDRPLKFSHLRMRKGFYVKRRHEDFLINFGDLPDVCPYTTEVGALAKESVRVEKRACAVVREVLGMMVEKRTLVDHLMLFRKEFMLPNKLRTMLVRHPELFYMSMKGLRDSVFLVEAYSDNGALLERDQTLILKDYLLELIREGKRLKRERTKSGTIKDYRTDWKDEVDKKYDIDAFSDHYSDGLDNLFEKDDLDADYDNDEGDDQSTELLELS